MTFAGGEPSEPRDGITSKWLFLLNAWPNLGSADGKLAALAWPKDGKRPVVGADPGLGLAPGWLEFDPPPSDEKGMKFGGNIVPPSRSDGLGLVSWMTNFRIHFQLGRVKKLPVNDSRAVKMAMNTETGGLAMLICHR